MLINYYNTCNSIAELSLDVRLILAVILTFLLTLVIGISVGILSVLAVNRCRISKKITLQSEAEMRPPPVIYEELDVIKPDPQTQGNLAYEQFKRDPKTEGNVAYEHVSVSSL